MWENLVFVVTTDNGGPITECGGIGAKNGILRGCKCNLWDGGVRGTAFINSPLLQATQPAGYIYHGLMHAVDLFPTLLLGAAGLPRAVGRKALDGLDMWRALQHNATSPRQVAYLGVSELYIGLHGPAIRSGPPPWPPRLSVSPPARCALG
jgi:arylsulfatase A-like enzyme